MQTLYSRLNYGRKDQYRVQTSIFERENGSMFIRKQAANKQAIAHIKNLHFNCEFLKNSLDNLHTPKIITNEETYIDFEYIDKPSLESLIEKSLISRDYKKSSAYVQSGFGFISSLPTLVVDPHTQDEFCRLFDPSSKYSVQEGSRTCVSPGMVDLNLDNLLIDEKAGETYLVDMEWVYEFAIPQDYIFFRTLFYLSAKLQPLIRSLTSTNFPCNVLPGGFAIPSDWWEKINPSEQFLEKFVFYENNFQNSVNLSQNSLLKENIWDSNGQIRYKVNDVLEVGGEMSLSLLQAQLMSDKDKYLALANENKILKDFHVKITSSKFFKILKKMKTFFHALRILRRSDE